MNESRQGLDLALIGMPSWTVRQPPHGLAIVAGIAKASEISFTVDDLNVHLYRRADNTEKELWSDHLIDDWAECDDIPSSLWDRHGEWVERRLEEIMSRSPTIVGFSVNLWSRWFALRAARIIRNRWPAATILFGGVDCFPNEHHRRFFDNVSDSCHILLQGEAEATLPHYLASFLKSGSTIPMVPGFLFLDKNGVVANSGLAPLPGLEAESPRPPYEMFPLDLYTAPGTFPFMLTRGCPYSCSFCSETVNFGRYRARQPEEAYREVVDILTHAKGFAEVPTLSLSDSIFNAHVARLEAFADLLIGHGTLVNWGGQGHIHRTLTDRLILKLAASGLTGVFWGIETGSQRITDLMKKSFRQEDMHRIVAECSRLGISQWIPILVGYPGETPDDLLETLRFVLEFRHTPGVTILPAMPVTLRSGAPLKEQWVEFGLANSSQRHWHTIDGTNTVQTRLLRAFVVDQARMDPFGLPDKPVSPDRWRRFRWDEESLRLEWSGLVRALARRTAGESKAEEIIADFSSAPSGKQAIMALKGLGWGLALFAGIKEVRSGAMVKEACGALERVKDEGSAVTVRGWAWDPRTREPAERVEVSVNGYSSLLSPVQEQRADLVKALGNARLRIAGWLVRFPKSSLPPAPCVFNATAILADGARGTVAADARRVWRG
jgi:hypothetical protein